MSGARDRIAALLAPGAVLNGIDYAELIPAVPPRMRVHFLNTVSLTGTVTAVRLDGGDRLPVVPLAPTVAADWTTDTAGRPLLMLRPLVEGDFSTYTLALASARLDPRFASTSFSFKVLCPSPFDCAPITPDCPPDATALPVIDYLAKDFASFRQLLLDDAAVRYPMWRERSEADLGVTIAEALSAIADELSYQQDRVAADLNFATTVSQQALVAKARLVDYEPAPARSAHCELILTVTAASVAAGARVDGIDSDGQRVGFEIGDGLSGAANFSVDPRKNWPLIPWWWDDEAICLPRGATQMWVEGDAHGLAVGDRILIQTDLPHESIRQIVTLTDAVADRDPLFPPGTGTALTRLTWGSEDALARDRDLALTRLGGNLVPATQGVRASARFGIAPVPATAPGALASIVREGPDGTVVHRLPLKAGVLAWVPGISTPEIAVTQTMPEVSDWQYTRTLLDSAALAPAFAIDRQAWRAVSFANDGRETHWEPDGDDGGTDSAGMTLRFGNGVFGAVPEPGAVFDIVYRAGAGAGGNLPVDTISEIAVPGAIVAARNPFAAVGGADAETALHVRRFAPQAFRARPLRAVRSEDYAAAAREIVWVQDAGTRFRWTGSWHSAFVAVDPIGGFDPGVARQRELIRQLDRRRMAGVEVHAPRPRFVSIDLTIDICVASGARADDVERRVLVALTSYFFADRFTFGTPLYRARLEQAVVAVAGVKGVLAIRHRRRAALNTLEPLPAALRLGIGEVLRIDNDPDWPERGTIRIVTEGGA
jgi:hypothetical protein